MVRTLATCSVTDPVTSLATFSEAAACSAAAAVRAAALRRLCAGPRLLSPGWRWAWGRQSAKAGARPSCAHTWLTPKWCQVRAQLGCAPAPGDCRPQHQRQPGLRRRRGPAHEQRKARRAAAQIAVARKEAEEAADKKKATEEAAAKRKKESAAEEAAAKEKEVRNE